ncbi:MAG: cytochrome ubiquinol oxidase subunit I [Chloroflexi bacterium]|nr:cytochrome ubiquinol oxidase subunit I [Ktedonobacteraceae bacterium]MBV9706364.1 cytochrome ubiquinol oxidase subunit I [Chloroflexota bacterium]
MPPLLAARSQMGTSLVFHIVFSVLGVGLPLLLFIAEGVAIRKKDPVWLTLARRWSIAAAIIFAIGAVSGTIVEFELGLLWPTYIRYTGAIIGPMFAFEGFAFFLEAIFFGIYLYGWNRLPPLMHWLSSIPIVVGGAASAWFIVTTNSWMNTPTGFQFSGNQISGIDTISAIFNPSTPYETVHMILACYVACGFGVAAVYAYFMLRGRREDYYRKGMLLGLAVALIATPLQIVSGDFNARFLSNAQQAKFAAMEGVFKTSSHVPLHIGGIPDPATEQYYFSINIPDGISILAKDSPNGVIKGLDAFKPQDRPNPIPVHLSFDTMVGIGFFTLFVVIIFWALYLLRRRVFPENRLLLLAVLLCGPLSFLAVELGWMVTELGRQPWVIYNFLRTSDAVTSAPFLNISFLIFSAIYVILAITLIVLLLRQARKPLPEFSWEKLTSKSGEPEYEEVGV